MPAPAIARSRPAERLRCPQATATATSATATAGMTGSMSPAATTPLTGSAALPASTPIVAGAATIQADPANNALIIMAPEAIYNNLRAVIEKLDVRRAQVFIEALIVELTADRAGEFGIQWQVLTGADPRRTGVQGIGGTNFGVRGGGTNIIDASVNLGSLGQGLNLGVINGTITIPGLGVISNLGLLIRALASRRQAPTSCRRRRLLTLDNEEARIIGRLRTCRSSPASTRPPARRRPCSRSRRSSGTTSALLLRVKPQITEGGTVRMVLYQEVSRVDAGTSTNTTGPTLTKRSLESSVVVDDQQIVVLGGLIQDSFTDTTGQDSLRGRPAGVRRIVPLRHAYANEDEPARYS